MNLLVLSSLSKLALVYGAAPPMHTVVAEGSSDETNLRRTDHAE
jgi:hypothetical protein